MVVDGDALRPRLPRPAVTITAADLDISGKLAAICAMDPAAQGGVEALSVARRPIGPDEPIPNFLGTGREEVHEVEPGFCVHLMDGEVGRAWRISARSAASCLRLRIPFSGQAHHSSPGVQIYDLKSRCTFIIQPGGTSLTGNVREGLRYRFCGLHLSQVFLQQSLGLSDDELPRSLVKGWRDQDTAFGHIQLDRAALDTAARFFTLTSEGGWRRAAIKAVALDLLRQVLEAAMNVQTDAAPQVRLRPSERRRLEELRSLAEDRCPRGVLMAEATDLSGLNKNKINLGFRQVYGMSLHDYCFELRMQRAKQLVVETEMPIVRVAETAGFSEATNFTAAFRKHFGVLPSEMRSATPQTREVGLK